MIYRTIHHVKSLTSINFAVFFSNSVPWARSICPIQKEKPESKSKNVWHRKIIWTQCPFLLRNPAIFIWIWIFHKFHNTFLKYFIRWIWIWVFPLWSNIWNGPWVGIQRACHHILWLYNYTSYVNVSILLLLHIIVSRIKTYWHSAQP